MEPHLLIAAAALAIDAAAGDPAWLYRRLPHPVALLGRAISAGERAWNRAESRPAVQLALGAALAGVVVGSAALAGAALSAVFAALPLPGLFEAIGASVLLAGRSLYDHVRAVATGLEAGLDPGREAVAHVVGRDPRTLDEAGVGRAAVESLAENFSDGVVAPVLWYVALGLPGLCAYKAVNTLDSMIGHRSARYEYFGKAAARLDDIANWIPARLAGALIAGGALLTPGARSGEALRTMWRDSAGHRSPNAGWPEAAMAGALGLALAGPRQYAGVLVDDPWLGGSGAGRRWVRPTDIHAALSLYVRANAALAGLLLTVGAALA